MKMNQVKRALMGTGGVLGVLFAATGCGPHKSLVNCTNATNSQIAKLEENDTPCRVDDVRLTYVSRQNVDGDPSNEVTYYSALRGPEGKAKIFFAFPSGEKTDSYDTGGFHYNVTGYFRTGSFQSSDFLPSTLPKGFDPARGDQVFDATQDPVIVKR